MTCNLPSIPVCLHRLLRWPASLAILSANSSGSTWGWEGELYKAKGSGNLRGMPRLLSSHSFLSCSIPPQLPESQSIPVGRCSGIHSGSPLPELSLLSQDSCLGHPVISRPHSSLWAWSSPSSSALSSAFLKGPSNRTGLTQSLQPLI